MFFLAAWATRERAGLAPHYANVWGCLCKNFMWQYFRIYWIVYKVASLLFRGFILWCTHNFKIFILGMKFRRLISSEIMNLGINIDLIFFVTRYFVWKSNLNLVSNVTNQFVTQYFDWTLNKFRALTIHQQYLGQSLKLLSNLSKKCYFVWKYFLPMSVRFNRNALIAMNAIVDWKLKLLTHHYFSIR